MKRLEGVYSEAYKTAVENNKKAIEKLASLTDEKLAGLDDYAKKAKRRAFAKEVLRTEKLANKIAAEIASAGKTAAKIIKGEMANIYGLNYDFTAYSINRITGLDLDWTIYDKNQLVALMQEQESPFTKIAYKKMGQNRQITQKLQNHLMQATILGESQQKLIRRIKRVTGQSTSQARRVAQTERTRVQSQGRNMGINEANEMGVETQRQWVARLRNTRDSHKHVHLEIVDYGKKFSNGLKYPGDPNGSAEEVINCFCLIKPLVKSVSPELAKHRAWAQDMSFKRYQKYANSKRE